MSSMKQHTVWPHETYGVGEVIEIGEGVAEKKLGNEFDRRGMMRMGKRQELRREFQFFSIWGYAVILGATWEFALIDGVISLPNGGTAGTIYMFLVACVGMFFVTLSMAEMASIAPTAGGQYHFCSEFAPKEHQKPLSYFVGFLCVLGWQTSFATTTFLSAQLIEAIIVLAQPGYTPHGWQTAMLAWGVMGVAMFANTVLFRKLPFIEGIIMFVHVFGFFAVIVVLWVMAPRSDSGVWTSFENNGWSKTGVACLVSLNGAIADIIGADSSIHLAEELKNAAYVLPRSMLATALMNCVLGFVMIVTMVYCLGDFNAVLNTRTRQPFVEILLIATRSKGATIALTVVVLILIMSCSVNNVTTSSRQLWSFARDGGMPFSSWLARVRPEWDIPLNAMIVSMCFTFCLTCAVIGSKRAYHIFLSLTLIGLLGSYVICIACVLHKRLHSETFPASRFNLGSAGNAINTIALIFLIVSLVFQFFPSEPDATAEEMNWSCLIYGVVILFFTVYYFARARHTYQGPVMLVRKDL